MRIFSGRKDRTLLISKLRFSMFLFVMSQTHQGYFAENVEISRDNNFHVWCYGYLPPMRMGLEPRKSRNMDLIPHSQWQAKPA